jgi:homeodomain-containing protein
MAMGRPKATLVLDSELREQLESLASSRSLPAGLVRRAKIILLSASGKTNVEIARQLETSKVTVSLWRCRFLAHGVSGLYDELRPGRPRPISDERIAQLVRKTLKTKPKAGTHRSIRQIAGRPEYRNPRCTASGKRLACSRIGKNSSSFRAIHFL